MPKHYQLLDFDADAKGGRDRRSLAEKILPKKLDGLSVLDVGCAEGFFCYEAKRLGAEKVIGIDRKDSRIVSARGAVSGVEFMEADFMNMDLSVIGRFDYVLCLNVLHHVGDVLAMLNRLISVTEKYLILEVPDLREQNAGIVLGRFWTNVFKVLPSTWHPPVMVYGHHNSICISPLALKRILLQNFGDIIQNVDVFASYFSRKKSRYVLTISIDRRAT